MNHEQCIWKYELDIVNAQTVEMPPDSTILSVQEQNGVLVMWVMCIMAGCAKVHRNINIVGTGHSIRIPPGKYIGTVQRDGLVWHIFDCGETKT